MTTSGAGRFTGPDLAGSRTPSERVGLTTPEHGERLQALRDRRLATVNGEPLTWVHIVEAICLVAAMFAVLVVLFTVQT
jgi:hypothetical protein